MQLLFSDKEIEDIEFPNKTIFLAGPSPRDSKTKGWRQEFIEKMRELGLNDVSVFIPEPQDFFEGTKDLDPNFSYSNQIEWEHKGLEMAKYRVFYLARKLPDMMGLTTNIEFGYWFHKAPNSLLVGIPKDSDKNRYIEYIMKKQGLSIYRNMQEIIEKLRAI